MSEPNANEHPYARLTPDCVLDAVESVAGLSNGRLLALNSYENRVYQVGLEDAEPVVVKFYRPERWSDEAILEEHDYTRELSDAEVPVVAPLADDNGTTLHYHDGFRFAIYPRRGGYSPDLSTQESRLRLGRFVARIHILGARCAFVHRPEINIEEFGRKPVSFLLEHSILPPELERSYETLTRDLLGLVQHRFDLAGAYRKIRLHGDCHAGNVLWTDQGLHFVDFDDSRMGPAVQDLWMLMSGNPDEMRMQLEDILNGYHEFYDFDYRQLHLIEALRTLRIMHYAAWLAMRWQDPAFPAAFPWFDTPRYWEEHLLALREQMALLQEPSSEIL